MTIENTPQAQPSSSQATTTAQPSKTAQGEAAIAPQESPSDKYKVKVNGKEVEVSLEELKRSYGLDKAAWKRFEEASEKLKQAESLKNMYTSKDWQNLLKAGWSEDELEAKAAEFLVNRAKTKTMTPAQLQQMQVEQEYKRLKDKEDNEIKQKKLKSEQEINEREAKLYQNAFMSEVNNADKKTWLDLNDPIILDHIIKDIQLSINKHNYDMPVEEAVKRLESKLANKGATKKDYLKKLIKSSIKDIDDNDLEAFLDKGVKGIREKSVEAVKRAESPFAKIKTPQTSSNTANTDSKKFDAQYYRKMRYNKLS